MLMASGLNFGFRRALPHLFGVALGFAVMVLAVMSSELLWALLMFAVVTLFTPGPITNSRPRGSPVRTASSA